MVRLFDFKVALMFLAGIGGVMAMVIGAMLHSGVSRDRTRHALVSSLPDLRSAPPGDRGIVEGRIAASVPPLREEFVAYLREKYASRTARTSRWIPLDGQVQPLTIDTAAGAVQVVNADYLFDREIVDWTSFSREESPPTATSGSIRIEGLGVGGSVMIVGRLAGGGAAGQIIAESIAGVDRKTYLERLEQGRSRTQSFAIWSMLLGPLGIAGAVWAGRRLSRDR